MKNEGVGLHNQEIMDYAFVVQAYMAWYARAQAHFHVLLDRGVTE